LGGRTKVRNWEGRGVPKRHTLGTKHGNHNISPGRFWREKSFVLTRLLSVGRHSSPAHRSLPSYTPATPTAARRRLCIVSNYYDQRRCARCPTFVAVHARVFYANSQLLPLQYSSRCVCFSHAEIACKV